MNINPLTCWQRAHMIERIAPGFSDRAKQTLETMFTDLQLAELWVSSFPGEGMPSDDAAHYAVLVARMKQAPSIALWREIEELKSRHGGMPPEQSLGVPPSGGSAGRVNAGLQTQEAA